jgi:pheromone shutdown-related protein TraB
MLGFPLLVRHAVNRFTCFAIGHGYASILGFSAVPLRKAIATKASEVHDVEILHVGSAAKMCDQAAKRCGFNFGSSCIVHAAVCSISGAVRVTSTYVEHSDDNYPSSVTRLKDGDCEYFIIGTAHVSHTSVDEVRSVIEKVRPDVVAVELCQQRYDALTNDNSFRNLDVFKIVRQGKTLFLLGHLSLSAYQRRMGDALGIKPGAELLAAAQAGRAVGSRIELIDRNVNVTLNRTWKNIGLWKRSMLLASLIAGDQEKPSRTKAANDGPDLATKIEDLKDPKSLADMLSEFARVLPEVKGPLIDERDQYLVSSMQDSAGTAKRVVAVVGAAHVPGMTSWFGKTIDRKALDQLPKPSWWWTALKWLMPILLIVAFVLAWQHSNTSSFAEMMLAWIVPTSVGAGLGTLIAGGSLLSVLSALLVAPIAAIHPLLGTGMVVGAVEAWRRKPSVKDCEALAVDTQSVRGFFRNPVTRILIIAIASGLGTASGFWVGVYWVAKIV